MLSHCTVMLLSDIQAKLPSVVKLLNAGGCGNIAVEISTPDTLCVAPFTELSNAPRSKLYVAFGVKLLSTSCVVLPDPTTPTVDPAAPKLLVETIIPVPAGLFCGFRLIVTEVWFTIKLLTVGFAANVYVDAVTVTCVPAICAARAKIVYVVFGVKFAIDRFVMPEV